MSENDNDDDDDDRRDKRSAIERHFGTVLSILILTGILWVADNNITQGNNQVEMAGMIKTLDLRVTHLKELLGNAGKDRYTGKDATADKQQLDIRLRAEREHHDTLIREIDSRVGRYLKRLEDLEDLVNEYKHEHNGNE